MSTLTAADMEILEFERVAFRHDGARDEAIRLRFGISRTRYTQRLHAVVSNPEAAAYDPTTVARVRARIERTRQVTTRQAKVMAG